jgi:hypothetical protein
MRLPVCGVLIVAAVLPQQVERTSSILSFFSPTVELREAERTRLRGGRILARVLDAPEQDLAVFAAGSLAITPESFVSRAQDIGTLRQSRTVPLIGRFSDPPTLADLDALELDEQDVQDLMTCRPGACGLKLSEPEIRRMQAALAGAKENRAGIALETFRGILLTRVQAYLAGGLPALSPYHDQRRPVSAAAALDRFLGRSVYLEHAPRFKALLAASGADQAPAASFLYWAVEEFGFRPVVRVTHVVIVQPRQSRLPAVILGAIQVYASHYIDAALGVTVLDHGLDETAYLGLFYQARVDVLTNFLVRWIVERRVRDEVETLFRLQLRRLDRKE